MTLKERFLLYRELPLTTSLYEAGKLYEHYLESYKREQEKDPCDFDSEFEEFGCTPEQARVLYEDFVNWHQVQDARRSGPIKGLEFRPHFKCAAFDEIDGWCDDIRRKVGKYGRQYVAVCKLLEGVNPSLLSPIIDFLFPLEKGGGKIYSTYLFNANSHTYCSETRPSYEMALIEYIPEFAWDTDLDKELYCAISEEIECELSSEIIYVHVSDFSLEATLEDFSKEVDEKALEKTVDEAHEEWVEYLRSNGGCWGYLFSNQQ